MASTNPDAVANQGEFHARAPGSEPLETKGHKPGILASKKDAAPEFHAEAVPEGTAPASSTYQPDPELNNQKMYVKASSTIKGATSVDVNQGIGHPDQDQK